MKWPNKIVDMTQQKFQNSLWPMSEFTMKEMEPIFPTIKIEFEKWKEKKKKYIYIYIY